VETLTCGSFSHSISRSPNQRWHVAMVLAAVENTSHSVILGFIVFFVFVQGEELGPLELQIHTLQKQIEARLNEITGLQQFWLRNQSELVKTLKDVQKQSEDMEYLKKQYTILLQKKLRIEGLW